MSDFTDVKYQMEIEKAWNDSECLADKSTAISHEEFLLALDGVLNVSLADDNFNCDR